MVVVAVADAAVVSLEENHKMKYMQHLDQESLKNHFIRMKE
jgi:hypothetical protein